MLAFMQLVVLFFSAEESFSRMESYSESHSWSGGDGTMAGNTAEERS